MKKKHLKKIIFIITLLFIIISCSNFVNADLSSDIWGGAADLSNAGKSIVGIIKWVGIAVLIGAIILKGIKFVSSAPEGQASVKKELVMLTIGAVLLFTFTTVIEIIYDTVANAGLQ